MSPSSITWRSPSNIAIVKYWGKKANQIPQNPSLSFTLSQAVTQTTLSYQPGNGQLAFRFAGKENPSFALRIQNFLQTIVADFPYFPDWDLTIESTNTFPHSAGIASSASAMSALILGLVDMEQDVKQVTYDRDHFLTRCSFYSRLASGSACRSLFPQAAIWGEHPEVNGSSDQYAIPVHDLHPVFSDYQDSILIVHDGAKSVSSSAGHRLMENHPFAAARYEQARSNLIELNIALRMGDLDHFGRIAEEEALTLHALMMCSRPGYTLMKPATLAWMDAVRSFREDTGIPMYFTLDAGPNLHLLYPAADKVPVHQWIEDQKLLRPDDLQSVLHDEVGLGPQKVAP